MKPNPMPLITSDIYFLLRKADYLPKFSECMESYGTVTSVEMNAMVIERREGKKKRAFFQL